jgi:hypothetical protein
MYIHLLIISIPIGFRHICNRCTSVVNILLLYYILFRNDGPLRFYGGFALD